jgi:recombination protein RecR
MAFQRHASIERLIECLQRLPGIGAKTAERLAYHLLRVDADEALALARAVEAVRSSVHACSRCFSLDAVDPCSICSDSSRDDQLLLVIVEPRDAARFEDAGFRGRYHVLQGRVSQLEGITPADLTIAALLQRVRAQPPREVCLATNPDLEGEATAALVGGQLLALGVTVTRLARGLPAGASITQVSSSILADAIDGRRPLRPGS